MVLPRPISSARIQFCLKGGKQKWLVGVQAKTMCKKTYPLCQQKLSQLTPSSWYSRRVFPFLYTRDWSNFFHSFALGRFLIFHSLFGGGFLNFQNCSIFAGSISSSNSQVLSS